MINDLWYKNAIIYCLSVGTYMDANGDGIGDFIGLTRRLDYLQGLGITAIWLMPFQVSPGRDDGYDVADYYGVDPRYGTLGDFVEFTHGCKEPVCTDTGPTVILDYIHSIIYQLDHVAPCDVGNAPTGERLTWRVVIFFPWDAGRRLFKGEKVYADADFLRSP